MLFRWVAELESEKTQLEMEKISLEKEVANLEAQLDIKQQKHDTEMAALKDSIVRTILIFFAILCSYTVCAKF